MDKVYGAGLAIGTLQGVTPFGTMIDGIQTSAGVGIQGPPRYQLGKATGQAIGGLALMVLGSGETIGGAGLNLRGLGAAVGVIFPCARGPPPKYIQSFPLKSRRISHMAFVDTFDRPVNQARRPE